MRHHPNHALRDGVMPPRTKNRQKKTASTIHRPTRPQTSETNPIHNASPVTPSPRASTRSRPDVDAIEYKRHVISRVYSHAVRDRRPHSHRHASSAHTPIPRSRVHGWMDVATFAINRHSRRRRRRRRTYRSLQKFIIVLPRAGDDVRALGHRGGLRGNLHAGIGRGRSGEHRVFVELCGDDDLTTTGATDGPGARGDGAPF